MNSTCLKSGDMQTSPQRILNSNIKCAYKRGQLLKYWYIGTCCLLINSNVLSVKIWWLSIDAAFLKRAWQLNPTRGVHNVYYLFQKARKDGAGSTALLTAAGLVPHPSQLLKLGCQVKEQCISRKTDWRDWRDCRALRPRTRSLMVRL